MARQRPSAAVPFMRWATVPSSPGQRERAPVGAAAGTTLIATEQPPDLAWRGSVGPREPGAVLHPDRSVPSSWANFLTLRAPRRVVPLAPRRDAARRLRSISAKKLFEGLRVAAIRLLDPGRADASQRRLGESSPGEVGAAGASLDAHAGAPEPALQRPRGDQLRVLGVMAMGDARVEGEARQRGQLPGRVDAGGRHPPAAVEDRVVGADLSGHSLDPGLADVARQIAQRSQRQSVVAREAGTPQRRIAGADQDQAPSQGVALDRVSGARVQPRLQSRRGAEAVEQRPPS